MIALGMVRRRLGPARVQVCALAAPLLLCNAFAALADGALAVGIPAAGATEGIAYGYRVDAATPEQATGDALAQCHSAEQAPESARDACMVVGSFTERCAAISYDPMDGTPGWGFGFAADSRVAGDLAVDACRKRAGGRADFCAVERVACDGSAK